jgi:PAS domain S-box-containing protein
MNPAFTDVFGWTMAEMEGKPIPYLPESEKEATMAHRKEILETGEPLQGFETKRRAKDGGVRDVCVSGSRYNDHEGNPAGVLVVLRDISERKRLEALLQQAQKMEAIGTLAGGIAHDFNNILGVIIGSTELSLSEMPENTPAHRYLMRILKAGNRAAGLVRQILAFSRQSEQKRKPIQPGIIIKEALKMLRSSLPSTIQIEQCIRKDSGVILSDPTRVHQIVMNLCTNAAHAMREKGGTLGVALATEDIGAEDAASYPNLRPGPYVKLTVSDTGHGMDPKVMERIFDPYSVVTGEMAGTVRKVLDRGIDD